MLVVELVRKAEVLGGKNLSLLQGIAQREHGTWLLADKMQRLQKSLTPVPLSFAWKGNLTAKTRAFI